MSTLKIEILQVEKVRLQSKSDRLFVEGDHLLKSDPNRAYLLLSKAEGLRQEAKKLSKKSKRIQRLIKRELE